MKRKNIQGKKFGRLTVKKLQNIKKYKNKEGVVYCTRPRWLCECDCGNEVVVEAHHLYQGSVKSCGCLNAEQAKKRFTTHGMSNTKVYQRWSNMLIRIRHYDGDERTKYYKNINVCERWKDSFENFYKDMGDLPGDKYELDRIDNTKGYSPDNCRWVTRKEQMSNTRNNIKVKYKGKIIRLLKLKNLSKVKYSTLYKRISSGWDIERALETPKMVNQYK